MLGGTFLMLAYFGCDQSQVQRYLMVLLLANLLVHVGGIERRLDDRAMPLGDLDGALAQRDCIVQRAKRHHGRDIGELHRPLDHHVRSLRDVQDLVVQSPSPSV